MAQIPTYGTSGSTLPRIGGALAMAGTFIGTGIFVLGCFGFGAAFYLSPLPLILGVVGLLLCLTGLFTKNIAVEDPHVVAGLLISIAVIAGALLEIMILLGKPIFAGGAS